MAKQQPDFLQQQLPLYERASIEAISESDGAVCYKEPEHESDLEIDCFTVSELTSYLQELIESDPLLNAPIVVRGELSNVNPSSRGHIYFSLKDDEACIRGIIWAGLAKTLSFELEDGLEVYVTGSIEIYPPSGTYSIVAKKIEPVGIGSLQLAFLQLKERLTAEGLFAPELKKPLPEFPRRIGIVTSKTGAVIHDILRVIRYKNPYVDILLAPVAVQGDNAAKEISNAIEELNSPNYQLDLLIVARGGGSFEDLFCFSEEPVVRAIFHSRLPVITGIGHEPDFSLADAAADFSASTPTAAAERAVPDVKKLILDLNQKKATLFDALSNQLLFYEQRFDRQATELIATYQNLLSKSNHDLLLYKERLTESIKRHLSLMEQTVSKHAAELDAFSPLTTLARGYAIASKQDGLVISSVKQVQSGETILLTVSDGKLTCEVKDNG